jgi:hypothetical protein
VIVLDTGGLYAALDANEALHGRAVAALVASTPPRVVSPFVLAELDYLIGNRVGHQAQMALVEEVTRGAYQLELVSSEDAATPRESWSATRIFGSAWRMRRSSSSPTATERSTSCARTNATSARSGGQAEGHSDCCRSTHELVNQESGHSLNGMSSIPTLL